MKTPCLYFFAPINYFNEAVYVWSSFNVDRTPNEAHCFL